MECLFACPEYYDLMDVYYLMEMLTTLSRYGYKIA